MSGKVLLVRMFEGEIAPDIALWLREKYGKDVNPVFVNPKTPEELDEMSQEEGVVGILLAERPLPAIVLDKGNVPCIVLGAQGPVRLTKIDITVEPL